jgi:hypothetical protein
MEELKSMIWLLAFAVGLRPMTAFLAELRLTYLAVYVTWATDEKKLAIAQSLLINGRSESSSTALAKNTPRGPDDKRKK